MQSLAFRAVNNPTKVYVEKAIRTKGGLKLAAIQNPYTVIEATTWDTQLTEAVAFTADNLTAVPLITALAAARGLTVADLVTKIMENANAFRTAAGSILGQQQKFLDELKTATDLKEILDRVLSW